jgi:hypothetical protein
MKQQRHGRGLVDAAALGLDDAVLDLVAHAEAVAAADALASSNSATGSAKVWPFSATGCLLRSAR